MLDERVLQLVSEALQGRCITAEEARSLFNLDIHSAEAAHIEWAAGQITRKASANTGAIYAQIGIDALPCPANCQFCSFAAKRSKGIDGNRAIVPIEDVAQYARTFDRAGVHLISLMATAALPFDRIIDAVRAVRAVVSSSMPILVNMGDMTYDQALRLKSEGVQMCYHAHRLGEGEITSLNPTDRLQTMQNIKHAGLQLMNAVEPVHNGVPIDTILQRMEEAISFKPFCSGVGALTVVPGTPMERCVPASRKRIAYYAAIMRLMAGTTIPFGTGGKNVLWVDAGTNPRGRRLPIDADRLAQDVARQRKLLEGQEWHVPTSSAGSPATYPQDPR